MSTRERQESKKDEDDAFDIEYYERTGGNEAGIQTEKIENIQRELSNTNMKLNNMSKHSLVRFLLLLVLLGGVTILLSVMFVSRGGGTESHAEMVTSTAAPAPTAASCPGGWSLFARRCYKYFNTPVDTWLEARDLCITMGGDLASVPNQETNDFLVSKIRSPAFVGGMKLGNWTWSDGSAFTYTNWGNGQPSGDGAVFEITFGQDWTDDGTWNDLTTGNLSAYNKHALCQHNIFHI